MKKALLKMNLQQFAEGEEKPEWAKTLEAQMEDFKKQLAEKGSSSSSSSSPQPIPAPGKPEITQQQQQQPGSIIPGSQESQSSTPTPEKKKGFLDWLL